MMTDYFFLVSFNIGKKPIDELCNKQELPDDPLHCTYADTVTLNDRDPFTGGECPRPFQLLLLKHIIPPITHTLPALEVFLRISGENVWIFNSSTQRYFKHFKSILFALSYNQDISIIINEKIINENNPNNT